MSGKPWSWIVGIAGTLFVLLVHPVGETIIPEAVGVSLQITGTSLEICGKAALGRNFGIIAANRGIVVKGPYRFVRHPIYLGYLATHIGFLVTNSSIRNIAVYLAAYAFQVARMFSEEQFLSDDASYREYCRQVRFRLIPGIF